MPSKQRAKPDKFCSKNSGEISKYLKKATSILVTEADLASEKFIVEKIRSYYPKHSILAEESGESNVAVIEGESRWKWIIDPLDGTTNYAHGYPCFCVTLAVEHKDEIVIGVTL